MNTLTATLRTTTATALLFAATACSAAADSTGSAPASAATGNPSSTMHSRATEPTTTLAPNSGSTSSAPTAADSDEAGGDITEDFKKFLSVDYAGAPWLSHITRAEKKVGGVWVYTDLHADSDTEEWGKSICTAGRAYGFDKGLKAATSRAADGMRLAMC